MDEIIKLYQKYIDVSLIDYCLQFTPEERLINMNKFLQGIVELRNAREESLIAVRE